MLTAFEEGKRLRIAVVGCGNHAYRSIFPSLDYVAVELAAVCDVDRKRAEICAKKFGSGAVCGSLKEVVALGTVDAVLLAVGADRHPDLACEALSLGLHVWMEKPPARDVAGVDLMIAARDKAGRNAAVGFKKMFMPGMDRMKQLLDAGGYGKIHTIQGRFPMDVPALGRAVLKEGRPTNWLNNGVHPLSAFVFLGGRPKALTVHRSPHGGGFAVMDFPAGAIGSLHLAHGHSMSGAMERYEVVCEKGHIVLENNAKLTAYRPGYPFDYSKGADFAEGGSDVAALTWEPQHTLSVLQNKAIFLQGFVQELEHFVSACLDGGKPARGTLEDARAVMECYEAGLLSEGKPVSLDDLPSLR